MDLSVMNVFLLLDQKGRKQFSKQKPGGKKTAGILVEGFQLFLFWLKISGKDCLFDYAPR